MWFPVANRICISDLHLKKGGFFTWIIYLNVLYRVLKVGYLVLGVLSNHFKVPANGCWRPRGNSINNKYRLQEGIINAQEKSFYVN